MKVCNYDCLNCRYPDCINDDCYSDSYTDVNKPKRSQYKDDKSYRKDYNLWYRTTHHDKLCRYYVDNREEILANHQRMRDIAKRKKMDSCYYCKRETPSEIYVFRKKYFCCEECLKEYLLIYERDKVSVIRKENYDVK